MTTNGKQSVKLALTAGLVFFYFCLKINSITPLRFRPTAKMPGGKMIIGCTV